MDFVALTHLFPISPVGIFLKQLSTTLLSNLRNSRVDPRLLIGNTLTIVKLLDNIANSSVVGVDLDLYTKGFPPQSFVLEFALLQNLIHLFQLLRINNTLGSSSIECHTRIKGSDSLTIENSISSRVGDRPMKPEYIYPLYLAIIHELPYIQ